MKLVIVGNSGSGKTRLAKGLAAIASVPVVHLDELFWQAGGFDLKRPELEVASLMGSARAQPGWVVEGVFGELAAPFLQDASALIWLNLDWGICEARLRARGSESKAHMGRAQSEAGLARLLAWASTYPTRGDARSLAGHQALFTQFAGSKACLRSEAEVSDLLAAANRGEDLAKVLQTFVSTRLPSA